MRKYIFILFILSLTNCSLFENEQSPLEIRNLLFTRNTFQLEPYSGFVKGEPLIISAVTFDDYYRGLSFVEVYNNRDSKELLRLYSYYDIPSTLLLEVLKDTDNSGIVYIKEKDQAYAYDYDNRRYTTSQETISKMRVWLNELPSVSVKEQILSYPALVIQYTGDNPQILDKIRKNDNVDLIESSSRAIFFKAKKQSNSPSVYNLKGVVFTNSNTSNITVNSGDTVWVEYIQPNSEIITNRTIIK